MQQQQQQTQRDEAGKECGLHEGGRDPWVCSRGLQQPLEARLARQQKTHGRRISLSSTFSVLSCFVSLYYTVNHIFKVPSRFISLKDPPIIKHAFGNRYR